MKTREQEIVEWFIKNIEIIHEARICLTDKTFYEWFDEIYMKKDLFEEKK